MKHTIFVGHYGTGKTNLAINTVLEIIPKKNQSLYLIDLDIVNPYFRSSDSEELLTARGVKLIKPVFANSNLDVPALPAEIQRVFVGDCDVVWDVGGDDAGSIALGRYSQKIKDDGYEMIYILNFYRPLTRNSNDALEYFNDIQRASRLEITGLVNNSNIGEETLISDIEASTILAEELSNKVGVPLLYTTSCKENNTYKKINLYTKKFW